jgi:hypothetical protein
LITTLPPLPTDGFAAELEELVLLSELEEDEATAAFYRQHHLLKP